MNHIPGGDDDLLSTASLPNRGIRMCMLDPETFTLSEPKKTFGNWVRQRTGIIPRQNVTGPCTNGCWVCTLPLCFLFYPLFALSIIFFNWQISLAVFGLRAITQFVMIYEGHMNKLREKICFHGGGCWISGCSFIIASLQLHYGKTEKSWN